MFPISLVVSYGNSKWNIFNKEINFMSRSTFNLNNVPNPTHFIKTT